MSKRRSTILIVTVAVALVVVATVYWFTRPLPILTVATWSGPYSRAQANALFRPFAED